MMAGHTPGPWQASENPSTRYAVHGGDGKLVAEAYAGHWSHRSMDEMMANKRLIAAAPDLLAAADSLLKQLPRSACRTGRGNARACC